MSFSPLFHSFSVVVDIVVASDGTVLVLLKSPIKTFCS